MWGDAVRLDLAALRPEPTAFVSNLPYHIAAPLLLDSIGDLPTVTRWCSLIQREVADRLVAGPGDRLYGGPSVQRALALELTGRQQVSRRVFVPAAERRLHARRVPPARRLARAGTTLARRARDRAGGVLAPPQDACERADAGGLGDAQRGRGGLRAPPGSTPACGPRRCEPEAFVELTRQRP